METALITGASSGIGYELAKIFAKNKINLVLVARNGEKLKKLKQEIESVIKDSKITFTIIVADLSVPGSAEQILNQLQKANIQVNYLINNAGFGLYGKFKDTDIQKEQQMINLNILTLTKLTKLFLPKMIESKKGKILNVASTAAFVPGPLMAVYYATKAYVLSFSEALANELKGTGVTVTTLCPGPTKSGFQEVAAMEKSKLMKFMGSIPDSKQVAEYGYKSMMKGKTVAIEGFSNNLTTFIVKFLPRNLVAAMVRSISDEA